MSHPVEEVVGVERMGCSSEGANPARGELFRLMVLSGPEGIMKPNAKKDLLEGDKECWNPDCEILAGHFVGSFENTRAREESEDDLKATSQPLQ
jgi:hypothetical protein